MRNHKTLKVLSILFGVVIIIFGLLYVNFAVYPFTSTTPNYSDVERVFNRMTFPADWKLEKETINKGIAGRQCPIESETACFLKSKTFTLKDKNIVSMLKDLLEETGCKDPVMTDNTDSEGRRVVEYECSIDAVSLGVSYDFRTYELFVFANS